MRCRHCGHLLQIFRLNPDRVRVEPYCERCLIYYETAPDPEDLRCSGCALDFATIRFSERLGCERCYHTFRDSILRMIENGSDKEKRIFEQPPPSAAAMARHRLLHELLETELPLSERTPLAEPEPSVTAAPLPADALILRIRIARNFPGIPYLSRLPDEAKARLQSFVLADGGSVVRWFEDRDPAFRTRRIGDAQRRSQNGLFEIRADDEDHIRLAFFLPLAPAAESELLERVRAFEEGIAEIISEFDRHLWFQAHPLFGFLNACPSNAGTGMRFSMRFRRQPDPILWFAELAELRRNGFLIRGDAGEGSPAEEGVTILLPSGERNRLLKVLRLFLQSARK